MDSKIKDNIKLSTTLSDSFVCRAWGGVVNIIVAIKFCIAGPKSLPNSYSWCSDPYGDTKSLDIL